MRLGALKLTKRTLLLIAGAVAFIAAFVWLLATSGPLAPVGVETAAAPRADLRPAAVPSPTARLRATSGTASS